jgi:site-specific recombinase XerD
MGTLETYASAPPEDALAAEAAAAREYRLVRGELLELLSGHEDLLEEAGRLTPATADPVIALQDLSGFLAIEAGLRGSNARQRPQLRSPWLTSLWAYPSKRHGWTWRLDVRIRGQKIRLYLGPHASTARRVADELSTDLGKLRRGRTTEEAVLKRLDRYRRNQDRTIAQLVEAFRVELISTGRSAKHVETVVGRIQWSVEALKIDRLPQLQWRLVAKLPDLLMAGKGPLRGPQKRRRRLDAAGANRYIAAMKQFSTWLYRRGETEQDRLHRLAKLDARACTKRMRRAMTPQEIQKLLQTVEASTDHDNTKMLSDERLLLYKLAIATGLRRGELAALRWEWVRLEGRELAGEEPRVQVPAGIAKNREPIRQFLPLCLVPELLAAREAARKRREQLVFPRMPAVPNRNLLEDLKAAGIRPKTADGELCFHALRHTFVTNLRRAGLDAKAMQVLARHLTPSLTQHYSHLDPGEASIGVNAAAALWTTSAQQGGAA